MTVITGILDSLAEDASTCITPATSGLSKEQFQVLHQEFKDSPRCTVYNEHRESQTGHRYVDAFFVRKI